MYHSVLQILIQTLPVIHVLQHELGSSKKVTKAFVSK